MNKTTLKTILKLNLHSSFLLDASGVIYNDHGPVPGIQDTITVLQNTGKVIVVTNNANNYPSEIALKFLQSKIPISQSDIISSGFGCALDPDINQYIKDKTVFVFGKEKSWQYIKDAKCKNIVTTPSEADTIVLTSTLQKHTDLEMSRLINYINKSTPCPVICINPDQFVLGTNEQLIHVIGYYAKIIEKQTQVPIQWFGKPYENFSVMLKNLLTIQHKLTLDKRMCFFDDNLENVINIKKHLHISAGWITKTGIARFQNIEEEIKKHTIQPDYIIPSLSIHEQLPIEQDTLQRTLFNMT